MTQMWVSRCRHPLVWPFQLSAITWAGIHVNTVWEHDSIRLAAMCAELLMPVSSWIWMKVQALKKIAAEQTSFPGFSLYYNTVSAAFFEPFFVSYVTQVTQAWPLLSVFFFYIFVMKRRTAIAIVVISCVILGSGCVMCEGWCKRHPSLGISSQQLVSPPLWTSGHTDRFGTPNHCVSHLGLK